MSGKPVRPDPRADIEGYLRRLGLERPVRPDVEWLFAAQRAHMERIPYENLEIQLGRATSVDPAEAIGRIVRGRGGYCFHLNGAFGTLLASVGYVVSRHRGHVRGGQAEPGEKLTIDHQALVVRCAGELWFVDAGLGDAPYEPMLMRDGHRVTQGPFTYRMEQVPWSRRVGGWQFVHDPKAEAFAAMIFAPEPVEPSAFAKAHKRLSTSPDSSFVRAAVVCRRDARGADVLRGRVNYRVDGAGVSKQLIDTSDEWYALLADVYGLALTDVDGAARERLWARVCAAHEVWLASRP